jgi:lysozyme family protein
MSEKNGQTIKDDFPRALEVVLKLEGGYSDDPRDSGGKTQYGITEKVARAFGYAGEMQKLPLEVAENIYRSGYWNNCKCDQLPYPLSLYVFDCAVNQGSDAAKKLLQAALGVKQDGLIGAVTLAAARKSGSETAALFMAGRALRYTGTRGFDVYGKGWLKRLFIVTREGEK